MFINDNDVGTDCEGSAELGEHTDVQAVREQGTDFTSSRDVERQKREGERECKKKKQEEEHEGVHARGCSYDVRERGRQ